jgi:hypothetical protein
VNFGQVCGVTCGRVWSTGSSTPRRSSKSTTLLALETETDPYVVVHLVDKLAQAGICTPEQVREVAGLGHPEGHWRRAGTGSRKEPKFVIDKMNDLFGAESFAESQVRAFVQGLVQWLLASRTWSTRQGELEEAVHRGGRRLRHFRGTLADWRQCCSGIGAPVPADHCRGSESGSDSQRHSGVAPAGLEPSHRTDVRGCPSCGWSAAERVGLLPNSVVWCVVVFEVSQFLDLLDHG